MLRGDFIGRPPMFLVLALLLLFVLPSPWNVIGVVASLVLGVFEVAYWQRRMRRHKVQTASRISSAQLAR
jgi:hypothetical protein